MILLSSRKLEQALASGRLESWSKVKYLILPAVLGHLTGPFYILRPWYGRQAPVLDNLVSIPCALLTAYLTYWGIRRCFVENAESDGIAFFERFAVLLIPPMLRLMTVVIPLSAVVVYAGMAAVPDDASGVVSRVSLFSTFSAVLGPIATLALYSMLRRSFQRLGALIKNADVLGS